MVLVFRGRREEIIKITSLIILSIFTSLILYLLLLSSESSLVVLHSAIVLRQLPIDDLFDIVDEVNALFDFFFVHTWVLVWLILIIVHELIKVAQVNNKTIVIKKLFGWNFQLLICYVSLPIC